MTHRAVTTTAATRTSGRRLRRALMEAGVVLSLTLAIVAVLCMFGFQRASAMDVQAIAATDSSGRLTMGAVLLGAFVAMCGITSHMLRDTLGSADRVGGKRIRRESRRG